MASPGGGVVTARARWRRVWGRGRRAATVDGAWSAWNGRGFEWPRPPPWRGGPKPPVPLQVGDAGLGGLILLLLTARPGPGDGAARGDPPEPGEMPQRAVVFSGTEGILVECVVLEGVWRRPGSLGGH